MSYVGGEENSFKESEEYMAKLPQFKE